MSELEQVITWLRTYEGHDILKDYILHRIIRPYRENCV